IQIRNMRAIEPSFQTFNVKFTFRSFGIKRFKEKLGQALAMKVFFVGELLKDQLHEAFLAIQPLVRLRRTAHPTFLLQEVQEHYATEQFLYKISNWFFLLLRFFFFGINQFIPPW